MSLRFNINQVEYNKQEIDNFLIDRPNGLDEYLFIHFLCDVSIKLNNKIEEAHYGACIIYEPGVIHHYRPSKVKFKNSYFRFNSNEFKAITEKFKLPLNKIFYCRNDDFIEMMIKDLETEFILKDIYYEESIEGIIMHLLSCMGRFSCPDSNKEQEPFKLEMKKKFKRARLKILQNSEHDWSLREMADLLNICTSRFCIYYKEFFHISPRADLIMTRISKAKYMLTNEAMSVEQISEQLGYNSVFHFIRQFKTITGFTPGKYSKEQSNNESGKVNSTQC